MKQANTRTSKTIAPLVSTAAMAAVLCVVSPWTLALGPIPLSLCTFGIYLCIYLMGWKRSVLAVGIYVLLGSVGMPVFSGFGAGLGKVVGPTGGYIAGYLLLAWLAGWFVQRFPRSRIMQLLGMLIGTAVLYALGTAWYCCQCSQGLGPALLLCVIPFLPGDAVKIGAALMAGPLLRRRMEQAGILEKG